MGTMIGSNVSRRTIAASPNMVPATHNRETGIVAKRDSHHSRQKGPNGDSALLFGDGLLQPVTFHHRLLA
jgi:hypothetical protein